MAKDLFGGLGGLVKGLSGLMPQDDPGVKQFNAQSELSDLKEQETQLLAQIGSDALSRYGDNAFPEQSPKLRLIRQNIAQAEASVNAMKAQQEQAERARQEAEKERTCPNCGTMNDEGVKFCQECGAKLGAAAKQFCPQCGAENAPGTRFCGECGARIAQE